jgi:hypothetical protein
MTNPNRMPMQGSYDIALARRRAGEISVSRYVPAG